MTENFSLEDLKQKFNENKSFRISTIAIGAIAILVIGFLSYRQWMWKPDNEKSKEKNNIMKKILEKKFKLYKKLYNNYIFINKYEKQ